MQEVEYSNNTVKKKLKSIEITCEDCGNIFEIKNVTF